MLLIRRVFILLLLPVLGLAQTDNGFVTGSVSELEESGSLIPLVGANVYWLGTTNGIATDENGRFSIEKTTGSQKLVISYVGYLSDTLDVAGQSNLEIQLKPESTLEEVEISYRQNSTTIDYARVNKMETMGEKELLKAACCNLSESFETSPSVDVSFTDAVTGTRQIRMLGLTGPYIQINRENMPDVRGISSLYGLTYIPGTWVESIQLNKGAGSVINGYESIAGQINVNLRNPASMDKLYANVYANEGGRLEANLNLKKDVGSKWGTALLLHGKSNSIKNDRNKDGFLDMPVGNQMIALNRWELYSFKMRIQFGLKGTFIDNLGGQTSFQPEQDRGTTNAWGARIKTERLEAWSKTGFVSSDKPYQSIGLQLSGVIHNQSSYFGLRNYDAQQSSFYGNVIYQSIIGTTNHKYKVGANLQLDSYEERLDLTDYDRKELVPGVFIEYTYSLLDKFGLVAGARLDHHNLFGLFFTPRLHLRYAVTKGLVLRASAGKGYRTANILSENNGLLASSRQFIIEGNGSNKPYGLNQESAWNYGLNITQSFTLDYRDGSISIDLYRTDFENQVVVDLDQSAQAVYFYNLNGQSWANSFQAQFDYEVIKRLDVRLAYRWYDVNTTYKAGLLEKPLLSKHRAFLNLAYQTRNHWKFDYTLNWQGEKRIPSTETNPVEYRVNERSPAYALMNAQVTKVWREKIEVYAGVENVLNYTQKNPILANDAPFSPYFDSTLIWGPIFGRNIYLGLRYKIR